MSDKSDIQIFHDSPPTFKANDRKRYFYADEKFGREVLATIRGDANKLYIMLAYGYFRATGQFYDCANQADIDYLKSKFTLNGVFNWQEYRPQTRDRHRQQIMQLLGYTAFQAANLDPLHTLIRNFVRGQKNPDRCFEEVCRWLFDHRIETPDFTTVKKTVDAVYDEHLAEQVKKITRTLTKENGVVLDQLFEKVPESGDQWQVHRLTLLKRFQQSIRPMKIKENNEAFDVLKPLYDICKPLVEALDYTHDGLKHFAARVNKKQVFQIKRLKDPARYLHLSTFVVHQFRQLEDTMSDTLMAAITAARHEVERKVKDEYFLQRNTHTQHTQRLVEDTGQLLKVVHALRETLDSPTLSDTEKVKRGRKLLSPEKVAGEEIATHVTDVQQDLLRVSGQALTMRFYEEISLKLQRKCNDIVLRLEFSADNSCAALYSAIQRFKQTKGNIDNKFPISFMTKSEQGFVETDKVINKSLYKVLLFMHIADAVKRDSLSIVDSYRYKKLDKYLISPERWAADRLYLLTQANMQDFADANTVLDTLALQLDAQYVETNEHFLENKNDYIESDGMGGYKLTSERNTSGENLALTQTLDVDILPEDVLIPIAEAIHTVNMATHFLDEFEHQDHAYLKERPADRNFYAGIIGMGAHMNTRRLAKLSRDIENSVLQSIYASYFNLENARRASDAIIRFVNKLPLSQLFLTEFGLQTSSDGQKWKVSKESFNANHSFKYGGRDIVLAEYSFMDARCLFPHSEVISGAEREAHYMIDGLLRNEVVKSDLHSTDTHGYTEAVFGVTYLLKFSFAPRIKNVHRQHLYAFKYPSVYKQKKFMVLPEKRLDIELLRKNWDDILRLVTSIKLGEVTASQIFKRLNSYSEDENLLYRSLKEFGRIPKSLYILRYIDDPDLRDAVMKQLNKGESGNRLNKELALGRLEYTQSLKEEQALAESCKRILKNVVVCWNFMFVSQRLLHARSEQERAAILRKVKSSSLLAWEHFNFHGQFDFSEATLRDSQHFDFQGMINPSLIQGAEGV